MRFGAANALRGITTLRTPFLKVAATFSASMSSGRVKRRVKLLVRRSLISHFCLFFSSFLLFFSSVSLTSSFTDEIVKTLWSS